MNTTETRVVNRFTRAKLRRRAIIRRRITMLVAGIFIGLFISFGILGGQAKAASDNTVTVYKYYKSVYVSKEDTLWSYANQYAPNDNYAKYINEVKAMNGLGSDDISVGMCLVIPYYSTEFK